MSPWSLGHMSVYLCKLYCSPLQWTSLRMERASGLPFCAISLKRDSLTLRGRLLCQVSVALTIDLECCFFVYICLLLKTKWVSEWVSLSLCVCVCVCVLWVFIHTYKVQVESTGQLQMLYLRTHPPKFFLNKVSHWDPQLTHLTRLTSHGAPVSVSLVLRLQVQPLPILLQGFGESVLHMFTE